jgi:1,2-diacylglycerol 3-beta-galactosyltransferase
MTNDVGDLLMPSIPAPLLFLISDTGGGHRSAAMAVSQALERAYPGQFAPVIHDPLAGPTAPRRLRWLTALYGPSIRITPYLWGLLWHTFNTPRSFEFLRRTLFSPSYGTVAAAVAEQQPVLIVSFHAMTSRPAVRARALSAPAAPVVTVITDLVTPHLSWRYREVDRIVVPSAAVLSCCEQDGIAPGRLADLGLPVSEAFATGPLPPGERAELRRSLGLSGSRFLVLVTGGGEGSGHIVRRAAAIVRRIDDVEVVALCGRNGPAMRRLTRVARGCGGRLIVKPFVDNMADWLRCADVVVTKAGPGTIAEAACCGAPLIVTTHVPGQEQGNAQFVADAGAGRYAPTIRGLVEQVSELRADPAALEAMRAASARLGRPSAAMDTATLIAKLAIAAGAREADERRPVAD